MCARSSSLHLLVARCAREIHIQFRPCKDITQTLLCDYDGYGATE